VRKPTLFDARSFLDPFITGIHVLQQIVISNYLFGQVFAVAGNAGANHKSKVEDTK
jgi:hypothetical protein